MGLFNKIKENLGRNQPPTISIQGNKFTCRDAAGNELQPVDTLDVIFVDANRNKSKVYRENKKFNPNDPLPPDCFSDNGIAPSVYATKPQADTCLLCKHNERGSRISDVSGAAIKDCEDRQRLAVIVADDPQRILYRFDITPGSLKAFNQYSLHVTGNNYDLDTVITRLSFVPKSTGLVAFDAVAAVIDEDAKWIASVQGSKAAQLVTGEDDRPRGLPAPEKREAIEHATVSDDDNGQAPTRVQSGPTREQLEQTLLAKRAAEAAPAKRPKPKVVEAEPVQEKATEIPAFLSRGGMVQNPSRPPDEVSRLIEAQAAPAQASPLGDRLAQAFKLPTRSA
jgi:hypothetical protein